ncbi:MAG: DUF4864 domain-containing protein [Nitrospinota bacterium]
MPMTLRMGALIVLFGGAMAMAAAPAGAQPGQAPVPAGDRQAIRKVIRAQMDAFRRDDGAAAFSYASPSIRSQFQTPERFMEIVRRGYRPVYRPRSVKFLELIETGGQIFQKVWVLGPDGVPVNAYYVMERQPGGGWKIGGCILARPGGETI